MIYLNNFLFDFIQIWCIVLLESYVVPSWSCVGLVILTKVSHLQFSECDFCIIYIYLQFPAFYSLPDFLPFLANPILNLLL